jgi:hypothetical protein
MRVWLGLMGSMLWASMLAQPARLIPVAYDAERDAYYVADELVVGLEPRAPIALASEVMLWVGECARQSRRWAQACCVSIGRWILTACANCCWRCLACAM